MALNDIKDTVLTFVTEQAMVKQVEGCEFDVSKRTIAATKLQDGDRVLSVHTASEQAHMVLASRNGYYLRFPVSDIPVKKKTAVGVHGMKLGEGDLIDQIYWLEEGMPSEITQNDKTIHLNKLRISIRGGSGTRSRA